MSHPPAPISRAFDAKTDRTRGEEVRVSGAGLAVTGDVPADTFLTFDDPGGFRLPVRAGDVFRLPFSRLFIFHRAAAQAGRFHLVAAQRGAELGALALGPRLPNVLKTAHTTGNSTTPVWTAAPGRRWRLMRYCIDVSGDVTTSVAGGAFGLLEVRDGATKIASHALAVPATAGTLLQVGTGWVDLGDGWLCGAPGNALQLFQPFTLTRGVISMTAVGVEEPE